MGSIHYKWYKLDGTYKYVNYKWYWQHIYDNTLEAEYNYKISGMEEGGSDG